METRYKLNTTQEQALAIITKDRDIVLERISTFQERISKLQNIVDSYDQRLTEMQEIIKGELGVSETVDVSLDMATRELVEVQNDQGTQINTDSAKDASTDEAASTGSTP